jgi:hypothetical protein
MGKNKAPAATTEERRARRDRAIVQVRLDETLPEVRARIEADWNRREARARELRAIRNGTGPRNDAFAVPTSDEVYGAGRMVRGKDAPAKPPAKAKRTLGGDVVMAEEPDTTVSDGTMDDEGRVDTGQFVKGPEQQENRF